jgi:hypothetical protein
MGARGGGGVRFGAGCGCFLLELRRHDGFRGARKGKGGGRDVGKAR